MQIILLTSLALGASANAFSQQPLGATEQENRISSTASFSAPVWEDYVRYIMNRWRAPGMAVGVINGSHTWTKGFGYASLEPLQPVTPDTLFYTGSTTKSFTAAGLSLLIDNSSSYSGISWQTPVSHLLRDDFVLSDEWATEHITLEDALSHRTGYPRHDLSIRNSTVQLVRSLRHLPMSAEPRARFQYNNMMYATAGYVLEKLTGLDLGAFFHEYLWGPTGMNGTFLDVFDPRLHESGRALAKSYWWVNATQSYVLNPNIEGRMRGDAGAGAVISNVVDYTKYLRVMMAEAGPISKKGHLELKRPRMFMDFNKEMFIGPTTETYGLGWMGGVFEGEQIYWHTGTISTFVTFMLMVPAREYGIVVLANSNSKVRELATYRILYDLFGVEQGKRPDLEALFKRKEALEQKNIATCSERLYPDLPTPPTPASLPLGHHAGTYNHPGYGDLIVAASCEKASEPASLSSRSTADGECRLGLSRSPDAQDQVVAKLEHKTGEFWLAHVSQEEIPDVVLGCARTEFRVDAQGRVSHIGVDLRLEEDDTPLVWFERSAR